MAHAFLHNDFPSPKTPKHLTSKVGGLIASAMAPEKFLPHTLEGAWFLQIFCTKWENCESSGTSPKTRDTQAQNCDALAGGERGTKKSLSS